MIYVILKNTDGYKLTLSKNTCIRPDDMYELTLTEELVNNNGETTVSTHSFFMSENEIGYFARALLC